MWQRISSLLAISLGVAGAQLSAAAPVEIELVSARFSTNAAALGEPVDVMLSGDGRRALLTVSVNHPSGGGFSSDLFLKKIGTGEDMLVSQSLSRTRGNGESMPLGISHDGEVVVFQSYASDLARGDTNEASDIFMFFSCTGQIAPVSWTEERGFGNGDSAPLGMSPDGRFVVFESEADNLVTNDANGIADIFLYDGIEGSIRLVTEGLNGMAGGADFTEGLEASVSLDGRFVAFRSTATNLVPLMRGNQEGQIFVRDMKLAANRWLNHTFDYNGGRYGSAPAISTNGNVVAFISADLIIGPAELQPSTFLYYRVSDAGIFVIGAAPKELGAVVIHRVHEFAMTPDGKWIVALAEYQRSHFAAARWAVEIFNTSSHTNGLVRLTGAGDELRGSFRNLSITDDGRWLLFASDSPDLPGAVTNRMQAYRHDIQSGTTALVASGFPGGASPPDVFSLSASANGASAAFLGASYTPSGTAGQSRAYLVTESSAVPQDLTIVDPRGAAATPERGSLMPEESWIRTVPLSMLSADGAMAVFYSDSDDLAAGDANGERDIFVRDLRSKKTRRVSSLVETGRVVQPYILGMSTDGRRIAWHTGSYRTNGTLQSGAAYVYETAAGRNVPASVLPDGSLQAVSPGRVRFAPNGQHLFFESWDTDYVRNLDSGQTTVLRRSSFLAAERALSPTGRYLVAYDRFGPGLAWVCDLATGMTNGVAGAYKGAALDDSAMIFLRAFSDVTSGALTLHFPESNTTNLISTNAAMPVLSGDGSRVVYADESPGETPFRPMIYDVRSGARRVLRLNGAGLEVSLSRRPALSHDGRFVVLPIKDASGEARLYVVDTALDHWTLITGSDGLPVDLISSEPWISADGQTVLFESMSGNVMPRDWNQATDIFVARLGGGLRISLENRLVRIDWGKGEGKRLQYSDSLGGPWTEIGQAVDPHLEPAAPSRFFRVLQIR